MIRRVGEASRFAGFSRSKARKLRLRRLAAAHFECGDNISLRDGALALGDDFESEAWY
jgi:hypothetical protein